MRRNPFRQTVQLSPLELAGSGESLLESIGKGGGSVKYTNVGEPRHDAKCNN